MRNANGEDLYWQIYTYQYMYVTIKLICFYSIMIIIYNTETIHQTT